ncbi:MAG TPA: oligosaccharide flippase family protein, partial [Vicinamibacterales bacterium]|nr:oligosaccharide flippase family protein [Vicinamibacterales bacterium]
MRQKLRELSRNLAIYGAGDVAIQAVNFLLLRFYVEYLTPADYGILALLASIEAPVKLFFRWGIDGAFMRYWFDCQDERERQRLASTLFFFLLAVNGALLVLSLAAAPFISERLLRAPGYTLALQLVLLNTFAIGFTFIPFHVLRMEKRAREFSALTFARSLSTVVLRIVLVMGMGLGVLGVVVADVAVTCVLMLVMVRWFAPLVRPMFSKPLLRQSLAFGLPRVPHGFALQVMAVGDRFVLGRYMTVQDVGFYSMGVSFGLIQKIALGAFEYAWAPFYYATAREPDAARVFSTVTTYGVAVLALMTAGLSAIAFDLLNLVTRGQYGGSAGVVAWTAVGVFFYGVYLLTSIGLNITSRTKYYPVSTSIGAASNIGLCFALIPRFGIIGAAWANAAAYAVQAAIAFRMSQQFYPVSYEYARVTRAVAAAVIAYVAASMLPVMPSWAGVPVRGMTVILVMAGLLAATRFFNPEELRSLNALRRSRSRGRTTAVPPDTTELAGEIVTVDLPEEPAAGVEIRDSGFGIRDSKTRLGGIRHWTAGSLRIRAIDSRVPNPESRIPIVALASIGLGAFILRLIGLQYGLPDVYNPDEVAIMARALAFAKGSLNPHNFLYPTLYFYVLFAWVGIYLAFVYITGRVGSIAELQRLYFTDPTGIYTAGRMLGAVSGVATVLLVHRLAASLLNRRAGLAAALFMAAAPLAVRDSHYVKHDVFATMLIVAAYAAIVRVWPAPREGGPRRRDLLVASAACGAAFSTHYYCIFLALPLTWSIIQAWHPEGWRRVMRELCIAGGCTAAVFVAFSPFIAVEPWTAWRDIVANRAIVVDRAVEGGAFAPAMRYLDILWHDSMGLPVVLLGCAGAIWMLITAPSRAVLLLAFPVPFFVFISNTVPASRYLNPVLPFVAIFAAWTLTSIAAQWRLKAWMFWVVVAACAAPAAIASLRGDLFFRQADTRTIARDYI